MLFKQHPQHVILEHKFLCNPNFNINCHVHTRTTGIYHGIGTYVTSTNRVLKPGIGIGASLLTWRVPPAPPPQVWWTPTANWTVRWCGIPPSPPPPRETLTSSSTTATCSVSTASPRFDSPPPPHPHPGNDHVVEFCHQKHSCHKGARVSIISGCNHQTDSPSSSDPQRRRSASKDEDK